MAKLKITQRKSVIGRPTPHKRTVRALGLRRINDTVVKDDNATVGGMVFSVKHLVDVEEVEG